ncbi:MAG TPA: VWA domain-containing protein, partial [Candidatus Binataceae bacterium]|nr:VWA domain-containing protein [Candidatus Binataceae bacterium]
MTSLRDELLRFIDQLRGAGVRISVAETLDAMNAIGAAGLQRAPMREALAATLIKDEDDRQIFEELFVAFFGGARTPVDDGWRKRGSESSIAPGAGKIESESIRSMRKDKQPVRSAAGEKKEADEKSKNESQAESEEPREAESDREDERGEEGREASERDATAGEQDAAQASGHDARRRKIERTPFERYSDLEFDEARDALAPIARRFRVRLGRRLRMAKRGRIDFRRTIRVSIQHGGALSELEFRARRPRHIDLVILADVSGSVRYASTLMLELTAGTAKFFRRVRSFVFIDRLSEASFEQNHLVMTPPLDMYARSDFGRVLGELWERRAELFNRATVLIVLGDGRNNRRPARADLLREIARMCRAAIWLIPEERARWGSGDSAIFQYTREACALVPSGNLRELESALVKLAY